MLNWNERRDFARRTLVLAVVFGTGAAVMAAQEVAQPDLATVHAQPALSATAAAPFSSSADQATSAPALEASLLPASPFGDPMQYGGGQRGRYNNRPRYRGSNTNQDGSNKYIFYGGFGYQQPVGNTFHYLTPSWALQVGGGRQFSKNFALPIEFNWDEFGFTGQTLANQTYIYNYGVPSSEQLSGLDGKSHVWSFTVDPTYTFAQGEKWGSYGVAGVGYFHKTANFTVPAVGEYCDPFYGCYEYAANETIDKYTSNAPGVDAGFGITYKFSRFSNERFYGEVRYVVVLDEHKNGITINNVATQTTATTNYYPANSNRTTYFPIKFGIRF